MPLGLISMVMAAWFGTLQPQAWSGAALLPAVSFSPHQRQVSNWRTEAAFHLDASLGVAAGLLLGRDGREVTRCVRLNNYWCIKRAGWAGEIAADAEDHVAFASAAEGADVAALLLRRYYVDYRRHSARAIVARWAPASCGVASPPKVRGGSPVARAAADGLTTRGIGGTLRARFLARRGHRVAGGGRLRGRASVIPDRLIGARTATPSIALVAPEAPLDLAVQSLASPPLGSLGVPAPPLQGAAEPNCSGDEVRIAAYAARTAAGVSASPDADLKLFDADGLPTPNLVRVMRNMAAVEIGPLGASQSLVTAAVDHARRIAATAASAVKP